MVTNPSVIELSALDGSDGFKINGETAGDHSGFSVSGADDINGDGFADLIIGAPSAQGSNVNSGASYVVFGHAGGFGSSLDLSALDGSDGFKINGETAGDQSGKSVSADGDINGDGFADFIVGAVTAGPHGPYSGAAYVVFGHAGAFGSGLDLSALNGSDGFKISGEAAGDYCGGSVADAGDINGDGFADFIVAAAGADPHGTYSGAAYVVFGHAGVFGSSLDPSALDGSNGFKISGEAAHDYAGQSVSGAGDINGDGIADIVIGAIGSDSYSGAAYVVFGHKGAFGSNLDLSALNGSNGFKISGEAANNRTGISVSGTGDVNGDGFADLIVGAYYASPHGTHSGASYVVFGHLGGFGSNLELSSLDGSNGFKISGVSGGNESGFTVSAAGDVNGDGLADLIIGAPRANSNGTHSGASYVVNGEEGGFGSSIDLSALDGSNGLMIDGAGAGDSAGRSVASAGDINNDGFADLIVGATDFASTTSAGRSYVIFGHATGPIDRAGTVGNDRLGGSAWNDTLSGLGGNDTVSGNSGNDKLSGGSGGDYLYGDAGNDRLDGGGGHDHVYGNSGNDTFIASTGHDTLRGGAGTDLLKIGVTFTGAAVVELAAHTASFGSHGDAHLYEIENVIGTRSADSIAGDVAANRLLGGAGDDTLSGAGGKDNLIGGNGGDLLNGGSNGDRLVGGKGGDTLNGDNGNDTLVGGGGHDILRGGAGTDSFVFNHTGESAVGSSHDKIMDFAEGTDIIDLSGIGAKSGVSGNQEFHFITGHFTDHKGELHAVNSGANSIVSGDVDGDGKADFAILVEGVNDMQSTDFLL